MAALSLSPSDGYLPAQRLLILHDRPDAVQVRDPLRSVSEHLMAHLSLVHEGAQVVVPLCSKDLGVILDGAPTAAVVLVRHRVALELVVARRTGNCLFSLQLHSGSERRRRDDLRYFSELRGVLVSMAAYARLPVLSQIKHCLLVVNKEVEGPEFMLHQGFLQRFYRVLDAPERIDDLLRYSLILNLSVQALRLLAGQLVHLHRLRLPDFVLSAHTGERNPSGSHALRLLPLDVRVVGGGVSVERIKAPAHDIAMA